MPKKFFDIIPPQQIKTSLKESKTEEKIKPLFRPAEDFEKFSQKKEIVREKKEKIDSERKKKTRPKLSFSAILIFSLIFLILIGVGASFIFIKTKIEIIPKTENFNLKETIIIDSQVTQSDFSKKIISGKVFRDQRSASQDFPATGKAIKEEKAQGTVRIYNAYSDSSQTLINSTRLVSSEGKLFKLTQKAVVPGKKIEGGKWVPGYIDVAVQAAETGEGYNIGPSTFSIPGFVGTAKYTAFYGKSFLAMTGGFKGEVSQITSEDLEKARDSLRQKLEKESQNFLNNIVPNGFILIAGATSQQFTQKNVSAEEGAKVDSFTLQGETQSEVLVFKKSDIDSFAKDIIGSKIPPEKKFREDSLNIGYNLRNQESDKLTVDLSIDVKTYPNLDLNEIKKALLGKSLQEVKTLLGEYSEEIKISPFWVRKITENIKKVEIGLNLNK